MAPTDEMMLEIQRSKIRQARAMSLEQKLRAGVQMFGRVRRAMMTGIRAEFPEADEGEVEQIFRKRLALSKRNQNAKPR